MSSSNDTSSSSSGSVSDSSLPPEAPDSSSPPPPSPPSPSSPPSPQPDNFSSFILSEADGPLPSTFASVIKAPPIDDEGSPSSSPPAPPNSGNTPPAPTGGSDSNASDGNPSPPPEDSATSPPPPSPPPPQLPSVVGAVNPPPSPVPTTRTSPAPPGSPPAPISENIPTFPVDDNAVTAPNTAKEPPQSEPTDPLSPSENSVAIPSPGANSATGKRTPSPPQGITTPTSESNILSPPTATATSTSTPTRTPNNSAHSADTTPVKSPLGQSNAPSSGSSSHSDVAVGAAVAGVFAIVLVAVVFVFTRRKKRRRETYTGPYMPPNNFCVKSDGNYYPHQHAGNSGSSEGFYTQVPHTPIGNSFGSQKGTGYSGSGMESGVINSAKFFFSYEELKEITAGFSRQNILGEGGFGCVYQGWLPEGKPVAVKQLKAGSGQGEREFKAEVEIISRVHHRHLVSLVGYCVSERHRLLIYEFVPNKTLEHHLHSSMEPSLSSTISLK